MMMMLKADINKWLNELQHFSLRIIFKDGFKLDEKIFGVMIGFQNTTSGDANSIYPS